MNATCFYLNEISNLYQQEIVQTDYGWKSWFKQKFVDFDKISFLFCLLNEFEERHVCWNVFSNVFPLFDLSNVLKNQLKWRNDTTWLLKRNEIFRWLKNKWKNESND